MSNWGHFVENQEYLKLFYKAIGSDLKELRKLLINLMLRNPATHANLTPIVKNHIEVRLQQLPLEQQKAILVTFYKDAGLNKDIIWREYSIKTGLSPDSVSFNVALNEVINDIGLTTEIAQHETWMLSVAIPESVTTRSFVHFIPKLIETVDDLNAEGIELPSNLAEKIKEIKKDYSKYEEWLAHDMQKYIDGEMNPLTEGALAGDTSTFGFDQSTVWHDPLAEDYGKIKNELQEIWNQSGYSGTTKNRYKLHTEVINRIQNVYGIDDTLANDIINLMLKHMNLDTADIGITQGNWDRALVEIANLLNENTTGSKIDVFNLNKEQIFELMQPDFGDMTIKDFDSPQPNTISEFLDTLNDADKEIAFNILNKNGEYNHLKDSYKNIENFFSDVSGSDAISSGGWNQIQYSYINNQQVIINRLNELNNKDGFKFIEFPKYENLNFYKYETGKRPHAHLGNAGGFAENFVWPGLEITKPENLPIGPDGKIIKHITPEGVEENVMGDAFKDLIKLEDIETTPTNVVDDIYDAALEIFDTPDLYHNKMEHSKLIQELMDRGFEFDDVEKLLNDMFKLQLRDASAERRGFENISKEEFIKYFDEIKNRPSTNVVDDVPTLNSDLVWREDLGEEVKYPGSNSDQPRWKDGVVKKNDILKPNLNYEDIKRILPKILDGTVSDIDFTRFGIWLMHTSPTPAFGTKPFNSSDALADVTKIVIFNGKSPIDLVNENTLEMMKNYMSGVSTDITTGPNAGYKSAIGLSDELILQFGREEGPFANAQQRMKQTIINEHNKLYANSEDYFILFRGGALTNDPVQSFSKDGIQAHSVGYQTNQETIRRGRGIDGYFVHKNDFIDLHSLGLDAKGEKEIIAYKEAVDNPWSKTVINPKEGNINYLSKKRLKFLVENWYITSSELPKEGFTVPDTPTNVVDDVVVEKLIPLELKITDPVGLHMRPATQLITELGNDSKYLKVVQADGSVKEIGAIGLIGMQLKSGDSINLMVPEGKEIKPIRGLEVVPKVIKTAEDLAPHLDPKSVKRVEQFVQNFPEHANSIFQAAKKLPGQVIKKGLQTLQIADPGDIVITEGMRRLLPRLGATAITYPALFAYIFYELTIATLDVGIALANAVQTQKEKVGIDKGPQYIPSFMGGKTIEGEEPEELVEPDWSQWSWKDLGKETWQEMGNIGDDWSISWKLSEPMLNWAFTEIGENMARSAEYTVSDKDMSYTNY